MKDSNGQWSLVYYPDEGWSVRISMDDGLVAETKERFATRELATEYFNRWAAEHKMSLGEKVQ